MYQVTGTIALSDTIESKDSYGVVGFNVKVIQEPTELGKIIVYCYPFPGHVCIRPHVTNPISSDDSVPAVEWNRLP